ncbi:glycyl-tRNA synthetase beta subunit [Candidatus Photodesmus blepharus]|uniref:Glycine--tRNA ligase beta subunit n=1 Tax=Candidatus Photodesmus blepharonis TaxID=1179155 RepID=A0A084CNT4_9GAMM|nr:glycine--tRNA ligase subunit beta [Candidatus Photodesmus blepharus]KEY91463.1 glycyl-tRNA synthetase beta subunit [Candidatus Photodesmus blepharus]
MKKNFLFELGTEELPPTTLRLLAETLAKNFEKEMKAADLKYKSVKWYATPRRLAVKVISLAEAQTDKIVIKQGPTVSVAFDIHGKATKAALGWIKDHGISLEQTERLMTKKGERLLFKQKVKGKPTQEIIVNLVKKALANLTTKKSMRWGNSNIQFIRPIKTLIMLLNDEIVEGEIFGIKSNRIIHGHRFMGEKEFIIESADEYPEILEKRGRVIADYEARKKIIISDSKKAATKIGGIADLEDQLVEEVTSLVEWPVVLTAQFEEKFLQVPSEALVYTMKTNQKYFPVYSKKNGEKKLLPHFIFVSNIESRDPLRVIEGNEKVVRSRLTDAEFFFKTDCKRTLIDRLPYLEKIIFQKQLGSIKDKTNRITKLSAHIAQKIGVSITKSKRAGLLAKCDLITSMVTEFPEIQGIMGMHYARQNSEDKQVALALYEQYMPRFSGDRIPSPGISSALAMSDKLDTIVGIFGIGQKPQGSDPFALRRLSLGVLRTIIENGYNLDLVELIAKATELLRDKITNNNVETDVIKFMLDRLHVWYKNSGFNINIIRSVSACHLTKPTDFDQRIKAMTNFSKLETAKSLATANKRVNNILAKFNGDLLEELDQSLLEEDAEKTLAERVAATKKAIEPELQLGNYQQALKTVANLNEPVNTFLNDVTIMVNNDMLKRNRFTLLSNLRNLFLTVADISLLDK